MFRPTIRSNLWLGLMTVAFLVLYYWSETSRVTVRTPHCEAKLEAAYTMTEALETLQDTRLPQLELSPREGTVGPLIYTMLGEKDSPITTDEGHIEEKITALNPSFAAAMVDMLTTAGAEAGDTLAVLLTGSMPGANIAVYAAAKALGLDLVVITSVGSSWWGANIPDFTWLDMERVLFDRGLFTFRSVAASTGGSDDHGGLRLSGPGRRMIVEAVDRNELTFIHQGTLSQNIRARLELFERVVPLESYKAVVNVGGGVAALGHRENGRLIPTGVNRRLPEKNYPNLGVVHRFAEAGVPVVHIYNIREIARRYDLPIAQLPLPEVGVGQVYEQKRYSLSTAIIVLLLMFIILAIVKYFDRQSHKWREQKVDPDAII